MDRFERSRSDCSIRGQKSTARTLEVTRNPGLYSSTFVPMDSPPVMDLYFPAAVAAILLISIGTLVADLRLSQIIIGEQCTLHTDELTRIKTRLLGQDGIPSALKPQDTRDVTDENRPQSRGRTRQRISYERRQALVETKGSTSPVRP